MDKEKKQKQLITWLNDAYAMEQSIVKTLKSHAKDAEDFPEIADKINEHIKQTEQHADKIDACIKKHGGNISRAKELWAKVGGYFGAIGNEMFKDKLLKNMIAEYATEHMEIATYTSIAEAARELGDSQTVEMCEKIISEEVATAEWLEGQIPKMTKEFLMGIN